TDTFDTFMESSWYYARFTCSDNDEAMVDDRARYWGAVDHYVGGEEHAILHLLYARFFHKAMRDEGLVTGDEPFEKMLAVGMVLKDGAKMSKSSGDAGDPHFFLKNYGTDALRMAVMFSAPADQSFEWSENGVEPAHRWLNTRFWQAVMDHLAGGEDEPLNPGLLSDAQKSLRRQTHELLAKAEDDYGRRLSFNTVIAAVMTLMNAIGKFEDTSPQGRAVVREALETAVIVMSPITPHICHRLWNSLKGESLEEASWPALDQSALEKTTVELVVQVNGKVRGKVDIPADAEESVAKEAALAIENVVRFTEDKNLRKVIYVPGKLINIVI
ncbi:MAG: class I tRNA ligase family protein, partial [Gammaproteobacteria bacterium]|nr:class I tRNA ligase family protein [Gammaproteobacteria bacterium]